MIRISNNKKQRSFGKTSFRLAALFVAAVVFSLVSALSKELYREYKIKKDIEVLKTEIEAMEKDNYELSQLLEYYKTDEYKEAEARKRLNLKGEGEQVVMIDEKEKSAEEIKAQEEAEKANLLNRVKWWNYFFASRADS